MKLVKYIKKNITDKIVYEVEEIYGDVINDEKLKQKNLKLLKMLRHIYSQTITLIQ